MASYIALMRKDRDSDYGVDFPDFPGCVTAGRTLDEAKDMAAEALAFHIEGMLEDGEAIAEPSNLEMIMADPDNADAVAFLVDVPEKREKQVRVQVTIAPSVLAKIDATATAASVSRSAFIAEAALEKISREKARQRK